MLLSRLVSALPLSWAMRFGRIVGWIWYHLIPIRRGVARANARRALGAEMSPGEQRRVVRRCFTHLALYAVESLRAPLMTPELSETICERIDFHRLDEGRAKGKGVIVLLGHIGNIDLFGYSQAIRGLPISVVVKDLHWRPAHDFVQTVRQRTGLKLIPPRRSKDLIRAALADNEIVPLVVDQHAAPHRAIVCAFFGQLAATSPAVARFALASGAPVYPATIARKGLSGHHQMRIYPELAMQRPYQDEQRNIAHNTQRCNDVLEGLIRGHAQQWLWLHKRWKVHDDPRDWPIPPHLRAQIASSDRCPPLAQRPPLVQRYKSFSDGCT